MCVMKLRMILASRMPLYMLLILMISVHACKNKKKVGEVSDTEAAKEQLEQQMAEEAKIDAEETTDERTETTKKAVATVKPITRSERLGNYFQDIAAAQSLNAANATKNKALELFSNPNAPVLIIIFQDCDQVDYDEPTTIANYLDYLKDTKAKPASVEEMVTDDAGKIKELVLRKQ